MMDGLQNFPSLWIKKSLSVPANIQLASTLSRAIETRSAPHNRNGLGVKEWRSHTDLLPFTAALLKLRCATWREKSDNGTLELSDVNIFVEIKHEDLSGFVNFETGVLQSGHLGKTKCPFLVKWFMSTMKRMNTNRLCKKKKKSWFNVSLQWEINMSWYRFIAS